MKLKVYFCFLIFSITIFCLGADEEGLEDCDVIRHLFELKYAPAQWKKEQFGWNAATQMERVKQKVRGLGQASVKERQVALREFFSSCCDHHVGVQYYSTELALLPFTVHSAQGRTFIRSVEKKRLPQHASRLSAGDEILEFGGKPIAQAVREHQKETCKNMQDPAFLLEAERTLTFRLGMRGDKVPSGTVSVKVRHKGDRRPKTYKLEWLYIPELIRGNDPIFEDTDSSEESEQGYAFDPYFWKSGVSPQYMQEQLGMELLNKFAPLINSDEDDVTPLISRPTHLGSRQGPLPNLGPVLYQIPQEEYFRAYIYSHPSGRTVGYLRIPSYGGGNESYKQMQKTMGERSISFAVIASVFEELTDALVIDQLDNPGGYEMYCYSLLAKLTDRPLQLPTWSETITQKDIFSAVQQVLSFNNASSTEEVLKEFGSNHIAGYVLTPQFLTGCKAYAEHIIDQWDQGHTVTKPMHHIGITHIDPDPTANYTKPILVLINRASMSCGDIFPAVLQDNGRAILFGTPTTGAGGHVITETFSNRTGIAKFAYTGSLIHRLNGQPIENRGAQPDIRCEWTVKDLQNNYVDYVRSVNRAVGNMIR